MKAFCRALTRKGYNWEYDPSYGTGSIFLERATIQFSRGMTLAALEAVMQAYEAGRDSMCIIWKKGFQP